MSDFWLIIINLRIKIFIFNIYLFILNSRVEYLWKKRQESERLVADGHWPLSKAIFFIFCFLHSKTTTKSLSRWLELNPL